LKKVASYINIIHFRLEKKYNCLTQKARCILDAFVGGVGSFSGILLYQLNLGIVLHVKEWPFTLTAKKDGSFWHLCPPTPLSCDTIIPRNETARTGS
jgi:hypothetical protein